MTGDQVQGTKVIKIEKEEKDPLDHPLYEKQFTFIASRYLRSWFIYDVMACLPILVFELKHKFSTDEEDVRQLIDSNTYFILFALKIFKLGMLLRIQSVINDV